jgi:hypothetical protein
MAVPGQSTSVKSVRRIGFYGFGVLTNVRLIDVGEILKSRSVHDTKSAG